VAHPDIRLGAMQYVPQYLTFIFFVGGGGKVYSQTGWGAMAEIASGSATEYMQMISEVP